MPNQISLYDKQIKTICNKFYTAHKNYKIEYNDLVQEAYLKLIQLSDDKPKHYIIRSIVNHLITYCKKWCNDPASIAESLEYLFENKHR